MSPTLMSLPCLRCTQTTRAMLLLSLAVWLVGGGQGRR